MKHNQTTDEVDGTSVEERKQTHDAHPATERRVPTKPRLFHYTRATNAMKIVKTGEIRPSTLWVPKWERPVVWFSSHPLYEPAALSATTEGGQIRRFTTIDELATSETPFRFEVDPDEFPLGWLAFVNMSGCARKTSRRLARIAEGWGANIQSWRISFEPVALERCLGLEAWFREWKPVSPRVLDQAIRADDEKNLHASSCENTVSTGSARSACKTP